MSKKKNTLNDLEEFLKLQASSLVTPSSLTEKAPAKESPAPAETKKTEPIKEKEIVAEENLTDKVRALASDKTAFYNFIINVTEGLPNKTKEDTLLINTALYLKGGHNWKEVVSDYWKNK